MAEPADSGQSFGAEGPVEDLIARLNEHETASEDEGRNLAHASIERCAVLIGHRIFFDVDVDVGDCFSVEQRP